MDGLADLPHNHVLEMRLEQRPIRFVPLSLIPPQAQVFPMGAHERICLAPFPPHFRHFRY